MLRVFTGFSIVLGTLLWMFNLYMTARTPVAEEAPQHAAAAVA